MFTFEQLLRPTENVRGRKSDVPVPVVSARKSSKRRRCSIEVKNHAKSVQIETVQALKIAYILGIPADYAQFMYKIHGNNYMYTIEDTARPNEKDYIEFYTHIYGRVAVVDKKGWVWKYTWDDLDNCARKELVREIEGYKAEERAVLNEYREKKRSELFFTSMQGKPSPKRQGRANSQGDIGNYVNTRGTMRIDEYEAHKARLQSFHNK